MKPYLFYIFLLLNLFPMAVGAREFGNDVLNAVYNHDANALKIALKNYPENNYPNYPNGSTPLSASLYNSSSEELTLLLLENNAPFTDQDFHGAVANDKEKVVALMIKKGANINSQDKQGWTALHMAIKFGSLKLVKLLVAAGANPNIPRNDGVTAKQLSASLVQEATEINELLNK